MTGFNPNITLKFTKGFKISQNILAFQFMRLKHTYFYKIASHLKSLIERDWCCPSYRSHIVATPLSHHLVFPTVISLLKAMHGGGGVYRTMHVRTSFSSAERR
jgi:hypothetical protein